MGNSPRSNGIDRVTEVHLHGWDPCGGFWHGPTELAHTPPGSGAILQKLLRNSGSFHGKFAGRARGSHPVDFHTTVYDLSDCGVAVIDLAGAEGGPLAMLALIPHQRRARIRADFAFEFVAFLRFLGGQVIAGAELALHDYIENTLKTELSCSLVFAIETDGISTETSLVLAKHVESVASAALRWLGHKDSEAAQAEQHDIADAALSRYPANL